MRENGSELDGLTAVVTGSSSGIGRAIALEFASAGADLFLHTRQNSDGLQDVCDQTRGMGREVVASLGDLSDPRVCQQLSQETWDWKPIDIWVNNAGADVLTGQFAEQEFEAKMEKLWSTDVLATIRLSRSAGQRMRQRGSGSIINVGWDQAWQGMGGDSGEMFSAIKGAIMSFSLSLARSLAPQVRVNCLAPGWIQTKWGFDAPAAWNERAIQESLTKRWGRPEDVAAAARFLASPAASFVNGQVLPINGGFDHAHVPGIQK